MTRCPLVRCVDCILLEELHSYLRCSSKGHYIQQPYNKRRCCRFISRAQTTLEGKPVRIPSAEDSDPPTPEIPVDEAHTWAPIPLGQVFLVDYDLPADHHRKRFYRAVKSYLKAYHPPGTGWSTMSVVYTQDERFAWFVYDMALEVGGRAHVMRAERLDV